MAPTSLLSTALVALALVQIWRIIQRLFFHPLASVPGPKLAAASTLYEFYWNAIRGGKLFKRLDEMHEKYGMRPLTNKLDKSAPFYCFDGGTNVTGVTTVKHEVHRKRRGAISKFLSAANVSRLEPRTHVHLKKMLDRFAELGRAGEPCDCFNAFRSLTMDIVSTLCEPNPRHNLDEPDFAAAMHRTIRTSARTMDIQKFIPIMQIMDLVPLSVWQYLEPEVSKLMEKRGVLGAGTETTSNTLGNLVFHVLSNPAVHSRLKHELRSCSAAPPDQLVDFRTLDKLPYLTVVIQETLRIASPVSGRLPRVNPSSPMTYTTPGGEPKTYTFPPGTIMSMSPRDLHGNAAIFPEPEKFVPERWLPATDPACAVTDPERRRAMDRYWVPFSRGSRNCIGLELAKQELGLVAGNLFRRFGDRVELFETTARDVRVDHDWFAPYGPADSKGVRIKIKC
ncbi:putative cytochrome p450 [Diplodia seriata]|uniref:Putative cytochrome p450 n=1 Tax=Diplodia seriata TaxID=420778 RepID=A0A0G2G774_9PEZI|nr:putative cytochrome p450 [Diplodia seriata]